MNDLKDRIVQLTDAVIPEIIEIRHRIHQHPEIAGEEYETSRLIRETLADTHIALEKPYIGTDVVGILQGGKPGDNVTLRADIDALPIEELNNAPYKSRVPGMMHACGHDAHAAILIGAAKVLDKLQDEITGSVRFVFQPGEENRALGRELVAAGALDNPPPKAAFALHVSPGELGHFLMYRGEAFAFCQNYTLTLSVDPEFRSQMPLAKTAGFLKNMFEYTGKAGTESPIAKDAGVGKGVWMRYGRFEAGECANIHPLSLTLRASMRYMTDEDGEKLRAAFEKHVAANAAENGLVWKIAYGEKYLPVINDDACNDLVRDVITENFGADKIRESGGCALSSEDFSYFQQKCPGAYFILDTGDKESPHAHYYNVNDEGLRYGVITMVNIALKAGTM